MAQRAKHLKAKRRQTLENVRCYKDHDARERGEPDAMHSFVMSLAMALNHGGYVVDPIWLMGASGFAFRIWTQWRLQPSAMNSFDWSAILVPSVERTGFSCTHVYRRYDDLESEQAKRCEAHEVIADSIGRGIPAIVWDPTDPPVWNLVYGYNDFTESYDVIATWGYHTTLSYRELGQRDVAGLSVMAVGEPNGLTEAAAFRESLVTAVAHAEEREQPSRPRLATGLTAFDWWADLLEPGTLPDHDLQFADYCGVTYCAARCYARDYLDRFAHGDSRLEDASAAYREAACELLDVWRTFDREKRPPDQRLAELAAGVRRARTAEENAIESIKQYLAASSV